MGWASPVPLQCLKSAERNPEPRAGLLGPPGMLLVLGGGVCRILHPLNSGAKTNPSGVNLGKGLLLLPGDMRVGNDRGSQNTEISLLCSPGHCSEALVQ